MVSVWASNPVIKVLSGIAIMFGIAAFFRCTKRSTIEPIIVRGNSRNNEEAFGHTSNEVVLNGAAMSRGWSRIVRLIRISAGATVRSRNART